MILGNTNGARAVTQGVFGHYFVLALAQQQADGEAVLRVLELGVYRREVKAQLPQMVGFEFTGLEFDHHVAPQLEVIKQQVDEKLLVPYVQQYLPSHEGKTGAQLQQKNR